MPNGNSTIQWKKCIMKVDLELTHDEVLQAVLEYVRSRSGVSVTMEEIKLEVKSNQNYRSEWEEAKTRVKCKVGVGP